MNRFIEAIVNLGDKDGLPGDERIRTRLQLAMALGSLPTIGLLAAGLAIWGHPEVVFIPLSYCAATVVMFAVLAVVRDFRMFRLPHLLMVAAAPIALHLLMGGLHESGGVLAWVILLPPTSLLFLGEKGGVVTLLMVELVLLGAVGAEGRLDRTHALTEQNSARFLLFNLAALSVFVFLAIHYFFREVAAARARSRELLLNILARAGGRPAHGRRDPHCRPGQRRDRCWFSDLVASIHGDVGGQGAGRGGGHSRHALLRL